MDFFSFYYSNITGVFLTDDLDIPFVGAFSPNRADIIPAWDYTLSLFIVVKDFWVAPKSNCLIFYSVRGVDEIGGGPLLTILSNNDRYWFSVKLPLFVSFFDLLENRDVFSNSSFFSSCVLMEPIMFILLVEGSSLELFRSGPTFDILEDKFPRFGAALIFPLDFGLSFLTLSNGGSGASISSTMTSSPFFSLIIYF